VADVSYGSLPFAEQIAFFRRKLDLVTNAWTDIWQAEHDHAFVVAGANRDDIVAAFREAIDKAISQGATLAEFRKDFDAIIAKTGWSYNGGRNWRSRVIYETNLRTSYAAGRYAQLQAVKSVRPYWQYVHSDAVVHPRPLHKEWGDMKLTLHADDPWWQTHFPPNGWGCQCTVRSLADRDLKRLGKSVDEAPADDMQTVTVGQRGPSPRTIETPAGIDPGFGYTPGRDAWLREQATRALQADGAATGEWEPVLNTLAADVGRPPRIPMQPAPVPLGERLSTQDEIVAAIDQQIGAPTRAFDVHGLPIIVDAEGLGRHIFEGGDLERTRFLPLLLDLLANPWEVWLALERNTLTGAVRVRARLIKGYSLGRGKALLFVADRQGGVLTSWTIAPVSDLAYANRQRRGVLWYGQD
jgi:hypothetical protein